MKSSIIIRGHVCLSRIYPITYFTDVNVQASFMSISISFRIIKH